MSPFALLFVGIFSFTLGLFVGQCLKWKPHTIRGYEVKLPTAHFRKPKWNKVLGLAIVLMAIAIAFQFVYFQVRQDDCNSEFRSAIKYQTQIAEEDNALRDSNTNLNAEDFTALNEFLGALLRLPPDPPDDALLPDLQKFHNTLNENAIERADNIERQQELDKLRDEKPYPDTKCGE